MKNSNIDLVYTKKIFTNELRKIVSFDNFIILKINLITF